MQLLSREDILRALEALGQELQALGKPPVELVVVGGAAVVLLYGARKATKDVDAVTPALDDQELVRSAAARVAESLGLPQDWLNDGAKGYLHGLERGQVVFEDSSLVVRTASVHQLLAMKLCAWRDDLDISDARLLLSKLNGDKGAIWASLEPFLVPGQELKAQYAFEDLWEAEHGHP